MFVNVCITNVRDIDYRIKSVTLQLFLTEFNIECFVVCQFGCRSCFDFALKN